MSRLVEELTRLAQQAHQRAVQAIQEERELCLLIESTSPGTVLVFDDPKSDKLIDLLRASRRFGEDLFEVAERLVLTSSGEACHWNQKAMAELVGVTPRVMNYKLGAYRLRPRDRRLVAVGEGGRE